MKWGEFNEKMKLMSPDYMEHNKLSRRRMWTKYMNNFIDLDCKKIDYDKCLAPSAYLAPLPTCSSTSYSVAVPVVASDCLFSHCKIQQEGITPMRYENNSYATASVQAQPTDTSVTRDYLLKRLASASNSKSPELRNLFNLYVDNTPKTYKDLIAIIKAGTYTIDPKIEKILDNTETGDEDDVYYYGPLAGIVWPGPVTDRKGYDAAEKEMQKQYTAAKDAVMVGSAAEGLAAIQAFEAWLPTGVTN